MFQSIELGELVTIGVVALIVFGPHRLPDIARKLGGYVRELRAAASDIKKGLDAEVAQLREPLDAVQKDLTKPVTEVKQSLSETIESVKSSAEPAKEALNEAMGPAKGSGPVKRSGPVQWIGPEPKTGVSPDDAWEGVADSVPGEIAEAPTEVAESEDAQTQDGS